MPSLGSSIYKDIKTFAEECFEKWEEADIGLNTVSKQCKIYVESSKTKI